MTDSFINLLLFTVAPQPTSPGVLMLSIRDAPTTAVETAAAQSPDPLRPLSTPDDGTMSSGAEPEGSSPDVPGDLEVHVTSTSFLVELGAHVTIIPGSVRNTEIEGVSPSTLYDITLQGLLEGERSLPLKVVATTGTWSKYFLFVVGIHHTTGHHHMLLL